MKTKLGRPFTYARYLSRLQDDLPYSAYDITEQYYREHFRLLREQNKEADLGTVRRRMFDAVRKQGLKKLGEPTHTTHSKDGNPASAWLGSAWKEMLPGPKQASSAHTPSEVAVGVDAAYDAHLKGPVKKSKRVLMKDLKKRLHLELPLPLRMAGVLVFSFILAAPFAMPRGAAKAGAASYRTANRAAFFEIVERDEPLILVELPPA